MGLISKIDSKQMLQNCETLVFSNSKIIKIYKNGYNFEETTQLLKIFLNLKDFPFSSHSMKLHCNSKFVQITL